MRPSDSVCYIRSLPNELLEKILLELIGLGSSSHSWNEYIVGELAKVCQRWDAVASRLALVNVRVEAQYSSDKVIERAYKLSKAQGGWTPTQVLQVSHDSLEGPLYRFAELVQLFGRTVDTLKVHCRPGYDDKASEGSFPPAIVGTIFFPMLRTLSLSEISPATAQECLRNVDPTKLRDMNLNLTIEPSPAEGYLNGIVFPQLEHLELRARLVGGTTFDDLKTATPALKSLEIEISNTRMSEFVAHMRSKWPGMLKHLDLTVRGRDKSVTRHHPAVREFLGLAKEKGVESFDMYVAEGSESWELSMRQEPQNDE